MEIREFSAFVAVAEEGSMSGAARRLHVSQSALSQTVAAIERELKVKLFEREHPGVRPTEAGARLLTEAREVLARYHAAMRTMARYSTDTRDVIRLGIPLELAPDILPATLARFVASCPEVRVVPVHMSTAAQFAALRSDELDVGLVRERPVGSEFDAMLAYREPLGVLLNSDIAARRVGPEGVALEDLADLRWLGFPRSGSPAWYDELIGILRGHGLDPGPPVPDGQMLLPSVKFTAVRTGQVFAFAPEKHLEPLPDSVSWAPLVGTPAVRRTWAVWPAESRRREIGHLIAAFEVAKDTEQRTPTPDS
ncbi:LysR family transcriptional regulator [Mycobacterium aquaticum]|uniref:Probable hydrogen peroxide-inducible genes activator n=1 Tax=Mycobacterium aquaticum TaxID=1927124 RepID=A0A1X0AZ76_9MYCO|nr:LysR family transcriptional regulator [Mycobacterium aquaticum]ORA35323.1 LysR family transcriptional regulator [Mycobacterium aquaticum]